jgi:hypothetical protein
MSIHPADRTHISAGQIARAFALVFAMYFCLLSELLALPLQGQNPPTFVIVAETFAPLSETWQPQIGMWTIVDGTYRSTTAAPTAVSTIVSYRPLDSASPPTTDLPFEEFQVRARLRIPSSAGRVGLVYEYRDSGNYSEAVFTASGQAALRRVIGGVITTLAATAYTGGGPGVWLDAAVMRRSGSTSLEVNGVAVLEAVPQPKHMAGQIGLISHNTAAAFDKVFFGIPFGDQPFRDDFSNGVPDGWTPLSGQWSTAGGSYSNAAVQQTNITLAPRAPSNALHPTERVPFTLRARMSNPYANSGNLVGIVFNYRDTDDYSELVFSPTGTAKINSVENGVRSTLASIPYDGRRNTWFDVALTMECCISPDVNLMAITVAVNGERLFERVVTDPPLSSSGRLGLITHWAPGKFDDVWFGYGAFLDPCRPAFGTEIPLGMIRGGTWNTIGGTLNNTSAGVADSIVIPYGYQVGGSLCEMGINWEGTDSIYRARLLNQYGASGNLVGLIYGYQGQTMRHGYLDLDDYYEVVFSPTGLAYLNKIIQGVRYRVASGTHTIGRNVSFDVEVMRIGINTTVKVNGAIVFNNVPQGELAGGTVGVVTHWAKGSFGDLTLSGDIVR